jgi:phosphoribosyl-ATP pyrophosphohydrolase / phosphoribosyl-AMP cyclohydrolase / histidinol dehydrogenase
MQLAKVEELEAHRRAVSIRIEYMDKAKIGVNTRTVAV